MFKCVAAFVLMCQLLAGSMLLPLSDFSLLQDIPRMYQAYEKVVAPGEKGVFDFVGDYLLGGKNLLGHNKHDLPEKSGSTQFQHTAVFAAITHPEAPCSAKLFSDTEEPPSHYTQASIAGYRTTLFRPPLIAA